MQVETLMRTVQRFSAAVLVALAATAALAGPSSPAAAPRNDKWVIIGPGGGGTMYVPTVSPHDSNTVLTRCDMTGVYISHDAGQTWRMFSLRGPVRFFVFDPVDPKIIYTYGTGLFRSSDGGKTWNLVFPDPKKIAGMYRPDDHAEVDYRLSDGKPMGMSALAVDPADSKTLFAVITGNEGPESVSRFSVSSDFGATWKDGELLAGGGRLILVDPKSPKGNRTVYIAGANAVSVLENGQCTHHAGAAGVDQFISVSGGFDSKTGKPLIYGTSGGARGGGSGAVFVTRDGGATWENVTAGLLGAEAEGLTARAGAIAASHKNGEVAYMTVSTSREREGVFNGVAKTTDAGKTWELLEEKSYKPYPVEGLPWYYPLYSHGWKVAPRELGVDPNNPNTVYGTDTGRTIRSTDGGHTWFACYSKMNDDGSVTTRGLDVTTCYGYHFDPFDPARHFISYTDIGLFRSEDGGTNWLISTENVPRNWRNTTYWIEFDPKVEGLVWGVFARNHDLPRPKMWRRTEVGRYQGGVAISTDGGRNWTASTEGMPETACTHVLLDPESPPGKRTLYVCGFGTGVWKSTDNGKIWQLKNNGIEGPQPFAWRLTRDRDGVLYCVVARRSSDGSFGNDQDGALYRSKDAAESWERITLPAGLNGPNGLAVDPENPKRLYLAAWGRETPEGAVMGGVWLSEDAGKTWTCMLDQDQHVYDVTIDPADPKALYACGFTSSAWRSQDRGETWKRIKGYNFKWGHRVVPDPENPEMIYITTFGGSVWYGPAAGDPKAVEDIVTPQVAFGR